MTDRDTARMPGASDVRRARLQLAPELGETPVLRSTLLSREVGADLVLKCENLQKTGSFKSRGALNAVLRLSPEDRLAGVVSVSAGNHAQALAWAARAAGISCTVVMPETAARSKVEASEAYGAQIVFEPTGALAFERARRIANEEARRFVHPFDDPDVIAGAGTTGLEILAQSERAGTVVVPVGGGGLIAGVAIAIKEHRPNVRVFGVEPAGAAAMRESLDAGRAVHLDEAPRTIADGLAAPMAGELNFAAVQRYVDDVVIVDDAAIAEAMRFVISRTKLLVEPAGAAAVAALMLRLIPLGQTGTPVVAILSGGNVDLERLCTP